MCVLCHGPAGEGWDWKKKAAKPPVPVPNLKEVIPERTDEYLQAVIKEGGRAVGLSEFMPALGFNLSDQEIQYLISFLRTLKQKTQAEGALLKIIEERKKRLAANGIFDVKFKRKLPYLPKKIGIITSPVGSVIHDIIKTLKERFPINVDLWPTAVQGNEAAEMIINAIKGFNADYYYEKPEVIIIARGGGSVEDLMVFNDEKLALVVFESKIPIVSAIGHETDTTIIDFVSDVRVPTPTSAAEKVVPLRKELITQIQGLTSRLLNLIDNNKLIVNLVLLQI